MDTIEKLIDLLTLEKIDTCLFRGQNYKTPWKRVFGGQVLGQALNAAYQTIPEDRIAHSMHGYFVLVGDIEVPILYQVDTIRDGGSFTTRRVTAIQKGQPIFVMSASFQKKQDGFDHQISMPNVLPPDMLLSDVEQVEAIKDTAPDLYQKLLNRTPNAIEFRPVEKTLNSNYYSQTTNRHVWLRTKESVNFDLRIQHQLLAYASDYDLLYSAVLPHQEKIDTRKLFLASLDHAMWFHRPFKMDDWLLHSMASPSAASGTGLCNGNFFNQKGELVATVMQQGLIRIKKEKT